MRGLLLIGPLMLLAGFSPPDYLSPQGIQEGPPKSWIPEKAEKPPITVTPELPGQPAQPPGGRGAPPSVIPLGDPQACAANPRTDPRPTEQFVNAYNEAKTALSAQEYQKGLALAQKAEAFATSRQMRSALLAMQTLSLVGLRDADGLEQLIAKRIELGCLTEGDRDNFERARETIRKGRQ
jgi:hypothetical protein